MAKTKILLLYFLTFCFSSKIYSQFVKSRYYYYDEKPFYFDIGAGLSAINCITDIGGANGDNTYYLNEIRLKNFKPGGNIYADILYHNLIGARLEGTWGQVRAADTDIKPNNFNSKSRNLRNLSFRSNISEISLLFEFHPLQLIDPNKNWTIAPYIAGGAGFYSFNPQTEYQGKWVDLKPLHTEGEGFPEYPAVLNYKLSQINIPVGLGIRYDVSYRINLHLEYLHRILFTDYLDDVSSRKFINPAAFDKNLPPVLAANAKALYNRSPEPTIAVRRGNPNNNDTYMSLSFKVGFTLGRDYRP